MKGRRRAVLLPLAAVVGAGALFAAGKALFFGRNPADAALPARVELSYAEAAADGTVTPLEVAVHYAPEIRAAVNIFLSGSGKGDHLASADFDGDLNAGNNWEHMTAYPLAAAVYWSVQETDTHYFAGYHLYHPRDDAEVWLDRHENDMEGIMLLIPKGEGCFLPPGCMYTQGHGGVVFYGEDLTVTAGSRWGGELCLDGDRPVIYVSPNGTLSHAGHSVESFAAHSRYLYVGDSGIRYYHGDEAGVPASFNGPYENNPCSYALRSLEEIWAQRDGPYGEGHLFASYGAFYGNNYRENAANPPWAWRNKTSFGFGGSFLSDPAWTFSRAVAGLSLSPDYTANPFADWRVTVERVTVPTGKPFPASLRLWQGGWEMSSPDWWIIHGDGTVEIAGEGRTALWIAAPADTRWRLEALDSAGNVIPDAAVQWEAASLR